MSRIKTYLGPRLQITPDEISRYENGAWAAEEKRDGAWAEVKIGPDGKIQSLTSRVGKLFTGDTSNGLVGLQTHLPNSILVGELEAASEAATDRYRALGYRRLHIFDAPILAGQDLTSQDYETRRKIVEQFVPGKTEDVKLRLLVVKQASHNFKDFYASVMEDGGEGLVFKKRNSLYRPMAGDGKVDSWIRCKPVNFVDYVVLRVDKSEGGTDNLKVGLYINGKLTEWCTIKNLPRSVKPHELVGKVIECRGAEILKSGALRHGHFERVRDDKPKESCTIPRVALAS